MLRRLRVKFICINMLLITGMLCVIFALTYHFTARNLEAESIQMLRGLVSIPFSMGTAGAPGRYTEEIRLPYFSIQVSRRGDRIAWGDGGYYDLDDENFLEEVVAAARAVQGETGVLAAYSLRFCKADTPDGERFVFADISSERHTLQNLLESCAAIGGISFLAFLLISLLLARWAVKPVEKAWIQQKQFAADASHELKTPLTVILTNAELLQNPAIDGADREVFVGNILAMARQMRGLVESLLELARVDNGAVRREMTKVDLSDLVAEAVLPFEPLYFERGLTLDCQITEGLRVKGSAPRLRQVVEIFLDNAMKYAAVPGTVTVSLQRRGARCVLSVANTGDPISPADLRNIFQRFYRVDKVRGMNHSYGLGLSIAEEIVREHLGKIWAESSGGVNTFFVELLLLL